MLSLQNIYKNITFLFLLICASHLYSTEYLPPHEPFLHQTIILKNSLTNQNVNTDNNLLKTKKCRKHKKLSYYLYIEDFVNSFIEIPTSNVISESSTISSKYLAGRASIYNEKDEKVGTCSASFLCMQNEDGIFTDISNYLSVDNGLIVSWFTPTTLINLELDSILHSMITECIVLASTKVGFNPFYGKKYNMIVSSEDKRIYFKLSEI